MSSSSPIQIPVAGREETSDQRHHHGSIDDPAMLAAYQDAVLQSARRRSLLRCRRSETEESMFRKLGGISSVVLRCELGLGFLSAVADRFGLWGPFGQPNVGWGNFSRFLEYTHTLNWYLPAGMIPALGVIATGAESLFGLLLLIGWYTRHRAVEWTSSNRVRGVNGAWVRSQGAAELRCFHGGRRGLPSRNL